MGSTRPSSRSPSIPLELPYHRYPSHIPANQDLLRQLSFFSHPPPPRNSSHSKNVTGAIPSHLARNTHGVCFGEAPSTEKKKKNLTYCVPATGFAWASGKATISRELLLQQCLSTLRKVLTFLSFAQFVFDKVSLLWKWFSFEFLFFIFSILAQTKRTYHPPPPDSVN